MYFARITGLEYTTTAMTFPSPIFRLSALAILAAGLVSGALSACAPSSPRAADAAPLSADESADALRLAQEARLELQTQSSRLKELEGQVRDLTEILSWTSEHLQVQERSLDSLRRGFGGG